MAHRETSVTVTLPSALLAAIDGTVRMGAAHSRSAFVATAVRQAPTTIENAEMVPAFAAMATDEEYQREALQTAAELERASWEALQLPMR